MDGKALILGVMAAACVASACGGTEVSSSPRDASGAAPAVAGAVPVDVVVLTSVMGVPERTAYRRELSRLLAGLRSVPGVDLRMALVAPRDDMDSAFQSAMTGGGDPRLMGLDLRVEASQGLLAAAVTGCPNQATDFGNVSSSSTSGPIVCGQDLSLLMDVAPASLEHDWLWDLRPAQGRLMSFLRLNARRVYVFVSSGPGKYLTAKQWSDMVAAQPQRGTAVVVSVTPINKTAAGQCMAGQSDPGNNFYGDVARLSSGTATDFCAQDWTAATAAAVEVVKKVAR